MTSSSSFCRAGDTGQLPMWLLRIHSIWFPRTLSFLMFIQGMSNCSSSVAVEYTCNVPIEDVGLLEASVSFPRGSPLGLPPPLLGELERQGPHC